MVCMTVTRGTRKTAYVTTFTTGPGKVLDFERHPFTRETFGLPGPERLGAYNIEFRRETATRGYQVDVKRSGDGSIVAEGVEVGRFFGGKCTDPLDETVIKMRLSRANRNILNASVQKRKEE